MSQVGENPRPNVATNGTSVPFEEGEGNPFAPNAAGAEGDHLDRGSAPCVCDGCIGLTAAVWMHAVWGMPRVIPPWNMSSG
jgi:hypothetical protein